jgi:hypothetical protein
MPDRAIDSQQLASFPATASITLEAEIEQSRAQEHRMGWMNYWAAYAVAILALTGSIAATVLVVIEANKWITATFAAMPVAVVAMTKIFKFEQRALAHWTRAKKLYGLLLQLRHEGATPAAISKELRQIDATTFENWPTLSPVDVGSDPQTPPNRQATR